MTTLFNRLKETTQANNDQHYSTVSVRAPIEIAAMVETVSIVTQTAVMNMFTSDLSAYLAEFLLEDARNIQLIEDVLREEFKEHGEELSAMVKGSCIEILEQDKNALIIKNYYTDDDFLFKAD